MNNPIAIFLNDIRRVANPAVYTAFGVLIALWLVYQWRRCDGLSRQQLEPILVGGTVLATCTSFYLLVLMAGAA